MPVMLGLFVLAPLVAGTALEYVAFRLSMIRRRWLRALPPLLWALLTGLVALGRWRIWRDTVVSPLTQILFVPGVPALFALLGMVLGWRLWARLWGPRVIRDRGRPGPK